LEKVEIGLATLYLGDASDAITRIEQVDAIITDPPYGVGFKYSLHDDRPDAYEGGYGKWLMEIIKSAEQKCAPLSPVFIWQSGTNIHKFAEWFPRKWRLFVAAKNFVQMRPTQMQYSYDPVIVWWTPGDGRPWTQGKKNRDFHVANTAPVVGQKNNIERQHPCPRPLDQVTHIIEQWCKPESTVLDLFAGSGTTGVACVSLGRKFIGVEKDPKYFEIACKRIEDAQRQEQMF
jgi:site-specific DNA-methyltransferase (adenine-specific)